MAMRTTTRLNYLINAVAMKLLYKTIDFLKYFFVSERVDYTLGMDVPSFPECVTVDVDLFMLASQIENCPNCVTHIESSKSLISICIIREKKYCLYEKDP